MALFAAAQPVSCFPGMVACGSGGRSRHRLGGVLAQSRSRPAARGKI
ncbi:MAG: hypothetical protein N2491_09410 [Negativicutes bacterium]|nr:hypothetical protein [Negativicutes bacterium]